MDGRFPVIRRGIDRRRFAAKVKTRRGEPIKDTTELGLDVTSLDTMAVDYADKTSDMTYNENPDILVQKKGIEVFDYMLNDDQIAATAQLKKVARLATDMRIHPGGKSNKDKRIAEFVRYALFEHMEITLRSLIYNMMTAMDYGYSISEKVLEYIPRGKWEGFVTYKNISPKSPSGFLFDRDEFGNLKKNGVVQNTMKGRFNWATLKSKMDGMPHYPKQKFVIYSHNSRFRNPYGTSDLRAAYRPWISKDIMIKYWNMYLEKYGAPIPMCEIPAGVDPKLSSKMKDVLASLQMRAAFTYPEGFKPGYMESVRTGAPGFEKSVGLHNGSMSRASLVPGLMGFDGGFGTGGSYGLGKTQYDVFIMLMEYLGLTIEEEMFHKQIIKPLVDLNFKNVENYPRFKFATIKRETRRDRAQLLRTMIESGLLKEHGDWIWDFVDLPVDQHHRPEEGLEIVMPSLAIKQNQIDSAEEMAEANLDMQKETQDKAPDIRDRGDRYTETEERSITDDTNKNSEMVD